MQRAELQVHIVSITIQNSEKPGKVLVLFLLQVHLTDDTTYWRVNLFKVYIKKF